MSKHIVSLVYRKKIGSMMRKAVLSYMADRANDDGTGIWCSKGTIANEIEASRQGVINTIKGLLEDALLVEVGERKCQNGYTMEYRIDLKKVHDLPFVTGKNIDTSKSGPVNDDDTTRKPGVHDPSTGFTQTSQNHPEPSNKGVFEIFEEAWKVYLSCPMKAKSQKKKLAKDAWKVAAKKLPPEQLLDAVGQAVRMRHNPEGFIPALPHMHRWLQREEWADLENDAPVRVTPEAITRDEWANAFRHYVECGKWLIPDISPAPNHPDCKGPADMIEHYRTISKHGEAA